MSHGLAIVTLGYTCLKPLNFLYSIPERRKRGSYRFSMGEEKVKLRKR